MNDPTFNIISGYSRAGALEDGVLVDVTQLAREYGFKCHVALTRAVHARYVKLTKAAKMACNDETWRLRDILWMASQAARASHSRADPRPLIFELYVVTWRIEPSLVRLKLIVGPGDKGEPVATILLPKED